MKLDVSVINARKNTDTERCGKKKRRLSQIGSCTGNTQNSWTTNGLKIIIKVTIKVMTKLPYNKRKKVHFFQIDNDYVKHYAKHLGVVATAVFTSLNMHANTEGKCFPSMELIAEQHGIDRHTVSRALKKLEEWNMINVGRTYNRKLKRRKNNTYELLPKELWKDLPVENEVVDNIDYDIEDTIEDEGLPWEGIDNEGHGTKNTMHVVSKIPNDGTEDASNNTHITRTIKEDSLCGQEPTKTDKKNIPSKASSKSAVWSSDKAILALIENDCKDYQIIGEYFFIQQYSFNDKSSFEAAIKRSLRAARALTGYKIDDIRKTMKWMKEKEFDMGWSLEAVKGYIDDCISTDFISDEDKRGELLNAN